MKMWLCQIDRVAALVVLPGTVWRTAWNGEQASCPVALEMTVLPTSEQDVPASAAVLAWELIPQEYEKGAEKKMRQVLQVTALVMRVPVVSVAVPLRSAEEARVLVAPGTVVWTPEAHGGGS